MVNFKSIEIEGLGSISEPIKYKLNYPGLTTIVGENGSGKTTIFSALTYVLYGQILKKKNTVETWEDKKPSNYRGTKVSLTFKVDKIKYQLYRHTGFKGETLGARGKDRLILVEGGKERVDLKYKVDVQKEINRIIGFSFELFKNSIIFGQKMKRIIEETGPNRNKVFEEAFEVVFISQAKKIAEDKVKILDPQVWKLIPEIEKLKERLLGKREVLKTNKEQLANFESKKQQMVRGYGIDILEYEKKIGDLNMGSFKPQIAQENIGKLADKNTQLQKNLDELRPKEDEHFKLDLQREHLRGSCENRAVEIKRGVEEYSNIKKLCPECGSKIPPSKINVIKANITKDINNCKKSQALGYTEIKTIDTKLKKLSKEIASKKDIQYKITCNNNIIQTLEADISKATQKATSLNLFKNSIQAIRNAIEVEANRTLDIDLKNLRGEIGNIKIKLKPLKKEQKRITKEIELLRWAIKDPLSNSGLKAYVFNEMLGLINRELLKYNKVLGWKIQLSINLDSLRKDFLVHIYQGSQERDYDDLSGGQQQLVNVCIAFATEDVVNIQRGCNILVMDEIFENLDTKNIYKIIELVSQKAKNKSVHLITHLADFIQTNCRSIKVTLSKDGITSFNL